VLQLAPQKEKPSFCRLLGAQMKSNAQSNWNSGNTVCQIYCYVILIITACLFGVMDLRSK